MIRNKEDFAQYLRNWGCPDYELDEVINLCLGDRNCILIEEELMDEWLEVHGYLITEVHWNND